MRFERNSNEHISLKKCVCFFFSAGFFRCSQSNEEIFAFRFFFFFFFCHCFCSLSIAPHLTCETSTSFYQISSIHSVFTSAMSSFSLNFFSLPLPLLVAPPSSSLSLSMLTLFSLCRSSFSLPFKLKYIYLLCSMEWIIARHSFRFALRHYNFFFPFGVYIGYHRIACFFRTIPLILFFIPFSFNILWKCRALWYWCVRWGAECPRTSSQPSKNSKLHGAIEFSHTYHPYILYNWYSPILSLYRALNA